jgi:V/A-type H+-transporting ATPase subunit E
MSVQGIIDRIMADAEREADEIAKEAKRQAEAIRKDNEQDGQEYYDHRREVLDERYRKEMERAVLNRRLDQRKAILGRRQEWMDRAFDGARKKLVDQPFEVYQKLMKGLVLRASSTHDEEVVFGAKGTDGEVKAIVSDLNSEKGKSFSLAKERGDFSWGFILRKGKVETNLSIDSMFKYKRNEMEQKAWELFNADV